MVPRLLPILTTWDSSRSRHLAPQRPGLSKPGPACPYKHQPAGGCARTAGNQRETLSRRGQEEGGGALIEPGLASPARWNRARSSAPTCRPQGHSRDEKGRFPQGVRTARQTVGNTAIRCMGPVGLGTSGRPLCKVYDCLTTVLYT